MTIKTLGEHTIRELLPHMKEICFEYGLTLNNARHLPLIKKIMVQRYYSIPYWD